jgi:integrase
MQVSGLNGSSQFRWCATVAVGLVVANGRGGYLDLRTWRRRIWKPACQRAGVIGATPYELRHTYASLLIHGGSRRCNSP